MSISLEQVTKENIFRFLGKIPDNDRVEFETYVEDRLYDRLWCISNRIKYGDPDVNEVRRLLYIKLVQEGKIKLPDEV